MCDLPDRLDESLIAGADAVVHAGWATRENDPVRAARCNVEGTRRLAESCRRLGVPQVIFISTISASPHAPGFYARSKHAAEACFDPQRDAVVRPGLILASRGGGLFQQLLGAARTLHLVPLFGGGRQPLQTLPLEDACRGIARVLEGRLAGTFCLAEPEPMMLGPFLRLATRRLGIRCAFLPVPFLPALLGLRLAERLGLPLPLRSESLLGLRSLRHVPVEADLERLGMCVRPAAQSLERIAAELAEAAK